MPTLCEFLDQQAAGHQRWIELNRQKKSEDPPEIKPIRLKAKEKYENICVDYVRVVAADLRHLFQVPREKAIEIAIAQTREWRGPVKLHCTLGGHSWPESDPSWENVVRIFEDRRWEIGV